MKAFTVMGRTFKALYDELFLWVWLSVLWWVGTVLILPAAPVTLGLHKAANRVANYKRVDSGFFYDAARQHIGKGWLLFALNLLMLGGVIFNIVFYLNSTEGWTQIIGIVWVWVLLLLLLAGQYFFPLFWQQDEPSIKMVLRNSLLLAIRHPLYSLLMLLFQIFLVVFSIVTVLPIFLLTPASIIVAANLGLVGLLQDMGLAPQPPVVDTRR
jgi:uncharacterized membrane protein YesL